MNQVFTPPGQISSYERELERYDRVHAPPTEHQATPDYPELPGWILAQKLLPGEDHNEI